MAKQLSIEKNGLDIANEISDIAVKNSAATGDKYFIFKLVDTSRKGRVYIDGIDDDILNPITGRRERVWLLSGSSSIWSTDLVEQLKDKNWVANNRRSLQFEGGILRIPSWDERALEFINVCRHFIDNPSRRSGSKHEFFEYNPAKQQQAALEKELLEMDMAIEASKMDDTKVRKLASFFGIIFYDELGQPKTPDGLRRELMLFAKRDPKRFKANLDSKEVEIAFLVRKAIVDSKIDIGGFGGNITWANGGAIAKIPQSRKPQEFLTELAMTKSDDGIAFLEQLQRIIK
jgi:hypothetical protein